MLPGDQRIKTLYEVFLTIEYFLVTILIFADASSFWCHIWCYLRLNMQ